MAKQTKLTEKSTRIPDTRLSLWEETIPKYLQEVGSLQREQARSHRFAMLLQELLKITPGFIESYVSGIEKSIKVRQKDCILKGRADNLFGNVIIEFEGNIPKKQSEAEEQLRRYTAILWSGEPPEARTPYLCIATDGVRFVTYSPILPKPKAKDVAPEDVHLETLEKADWTELKPEEVFYWLDRYFLRQEVLHPTTEEIEHDFGPKSHAFKTTTHTLLTLWQEIKSKSEFAVIYDGWEKYLRIVYGSEVAGDELFVRHTYLATLAKLMAWMRISENKSLPDEPQTIQMLEGQLFKAQGIENFIEEDFFSWLARAEATKVGVGISRRLFSLLQNYNLRELSEDVLKSLYQELVDPQTRHDLGEFYTPDWLAHRMVNKLLDVNPEGSLLDPACGSGTFLYLAIKEKRTRLGDSPTTLRHVLDSVYGVDVHPLAVIIAKTNYILALGELLKRRKDTVTIPIYLADTIRLPSLKGEARLPMEVDKRSEAKKLPELPSYSVELDGREIHLPEALLEDLTLYDSAIELAKEFAHQNKGKHISFGPFSNFLMAQRFPATDNEPLVKALFAIAEALKHFIDTNRDTIWAFILKNTYKPLFLKRKFDFVVGNPPWIAFRFMEPAYQQFLKRQITKEYRLLTGRGENIPNLEVATLFLVRASDLYLKSGGTIAFVLPKSLFNAGQHDGLRKRFFRFSEETGKNLSWREIWDCEDVSPLFNVSACVVIAEKSETETIKYPIAGQVLKGSLERKNAPLAEAGKVLAVEDVKFSLHERGKRSFWAIGESASIQESSYYKRMFYRGADIYPRSFWFVQAKTSPLGFNPDLPPLETAQRAREEAKEAYRDVHLEGTVEGRFLYATLLSTDLLPFGHLDYRLVVLPIEPEGDHHRLINAEEAHQRGFLHLARWLERVEGEWTRRRSSKAERITALGWLDYRRKLTTQNHKAKYRVIYPEVQRVPIASIAKTERIIFLINGQELKVTNLALDTTTYFYETNESKEAFYLASVLNSLETDKRLASLRRRGQKTHPHVHKKIFDVAPIPQFKPENPVHRRLSDLGQECSNKVEHWLKGGGAGSIKSIGKLRSMVRETLKEELREIDGLVKEIL